jgi:hypothetical protein
MWYTGRRQLDHDDERRNHAPPTVLGRMDNNNQLQRILVPKGECVYRTEHSIMTRTNRALSENPTENGIQRARIRARTCAGRLLIYSQGTARVGGKTVGVETQ